MISWLLLLITAVLAYVTYDAFSLRSGSYRTLPYRVVAKVWGQDVSHLSLEAQERAKNYNLTRGIGNVEQSPWAFLILFLGFAAATIRAFLE